MANPFKVIGDSLLGRLVPTWQAKADHCVPVKNVNEGYCWVQYVQCTASNGEAYCTFNMCDGKILAYAGIC
ncbi:hypothetical protein [Actinospica robiniae]|uniref:hypothetical protein n=1 Tax=Actinospica robiniae TaxID=304901 RepID=UPI00040F2AF1|nr:hypothetical protein [Actinospica robiniae]